MAKRPTSASKKEPASDSPRARKSAGRGGARAAGVAGDEADGGLLGATASKPAPALPLTFDQILGQSTAISQLRAAIASGRVHHAFVFHGPPGVGKFTTARAFAAELLDPRDGSPTSAQARAGVHPDLHVIRKELAREHEDAKVRERKQTNIPLDVLRTFLLEPASLRRTVDGPSAAGKVFIVDQAELIDPRGQNALLKTLEEPAEGTVLILVTSEEEKLLPTIRSRCQRVAFGTLADGEVEGWLARSAPDLAGHDRDWVLAYAGGSPGLAAEALAANLLQWHTTLEPMLEATEAGRFVPGLGAALAQAVDSRAAAAVEANPDASKEAANRLWAGRLLAFLGRRAGTQLRRGARNPAQIDRAVHALLALQEAETALDLNLRLADVLDNLAAQLAMPPSPARMGALG